MRLMCTRQIRNHVVRAKADRQLRVLYVAVQNPNYPRNGRIREYLEQEFGADITVLILDGAPGYVRHCLHLLGAGLRLRGAIDIVILAELSVPFAWVSFLLSRRFRAVHVVDFFIGLVETHVGDRGIHAPRSVRARILGAFDWFALSSARLALSDTQMRADLLRNRLRQSAQAVSVPVGAPTWARPQAQTPPADGPKAVFRVLYYGNYIPLHGVVLFIEALALLDEKSRFAVTMVGDGEQRHLAQARASELGLLDLVTFIDPVPEVELSALISSHEVVVGIFGDSAKASSVIANKVWQGLAAGKVVVTRESPALDEIAHAVGGYLIRVPAGSTQAIADALRDVEQRPSHRTVNSGANIRLEHYVREQYVSFGAALRRALPVRSPRGSDAGNGRV
jgi:glycosyltransferase involved in cell wall biosynthesis